MAPRISSTFVNITIILFSNTLPEERVGLSFVPIYRANRHLTVPLHFQAPSARLPSPPHKRFPSLSIIPTYGWRASCIISTYGSWNPTLTSRNLEEVASGLGQCPVTMRDIKCHFFFPLPDTEPYYRTCFEFSCSIIFLALFSAKLQGLKTCHINPFVDTTEELHTNRTTTTGS